MHITCPHCSENYIWCESEGMAHLRLVNVYLLLSPIHACQLRRFDHDMKYRESGRDRWTRTQPEPPPAWEQRLEQRCGAGLAQVAVLAHSWGDNVWRTFMRWASVDDAGWVERHVAAYVNIAGTILGVSKSVTSLLSGAPATMHQGTECARWRVPAAACAAPLTLEDTQAGRSLTA